MDSRIPISPNSFLRGLASPLPFPRKPFLPKLEFLRSIGFSNSDLPGFICSSSSLVSSSLQKQIVPCYNFLKSLPFSDEEDILKTLKRNPRLLTTSVENQIAPCYRFIKSLPLSDSDVVKIIERCPRLLTYSVEERLAPNIAVLREAGVPHSRILYLMRCCSTALGSSSVGESIKKATEMGFNPNKLAFVDAVKVFTKMPKPTLDKKMEIYRRCGMSDEEILMAFRSNPTCMALSEQNIGQTMDFVVKKMGWLPADLARYPSVINLSLEKRIIPRCIIVRYLQGKGLLSKRTSFRTFLHIKEKDFVDKFVHEYENDVRGLMDIYLGKISPK